jgi:hypothetical protein
MKMYAFAALAGTLAALPAAPARAQGLDRGGGKGAADSRGAGELAIVITDRAMNSLWILHDRNGNGVIDEPEEVTRFFGPGAAAGIPNIDNPNTIATRMSDGLVAVGDQIHRNVYLMKDFNRASGAMGPGEAWIGVDATNASGHSFAFPTGATFGPDGILYITNAGNSFGPDMIYRLEDLDGDGRFQSAGEVTTYVGEGAFGPGNGPYVPYEIFFDPTTSPVVGYMRNTAANLHGVYRFVDLNGNGRADDPGEFTVFFNASNASGLATAAGFPIEPDRARPRIPGVRGVSMYYMQTVSSPTRRQFIRLTDLNDDGDAQDAGEAVLVYETAETGFTPIDFISLPDGRVLVSDNSAKKVWVFRDLDNDGLFNSPGERSEFFSNSMNTVGDIRAMDLYPILCYANCDFSTVSPVLNVEDFTCFINRYALGDPYANCDGSTTEPVLNVEDFTCFINRYALGCE